MRVSVLRKNDRLNADSSRVVARYFMNGEPHNQKMIHEMEIPVKNLLNIMQDQPEGFEYYSLKQEINKILQENAISSGRRKALEEVTWLADSFYYIQFKRDSDISECVLFPISNSESRDIDDARFVRFTEDDKTEKIYTTYTITK
jgi:hypothetical protein